MTIEEFEKVTLEKLKLVDEAEAEIIDRVLKIIDKHIEAVERSEGADTYVGRGEIGMAMVIRREVLALKGGEQE